MKASFRVVLRSLGTFRWLPRQEREEIAQEALLRTWQTHGVQNPLRFAVRTARNLAIDASRIQRARPTTSLWWDHGTTAWQRQVEAGMDASRAMRALDSRPLHRRTLLEDGPVGVARDAWYKRRRRAVAWIRQAVGW